MLNPESQKPGLSAVAQKDREFLAGLDTNGTTGAPLQDKSRATTQQSAGVVPQEASRVVPVPQEPPRPATQEPAARPVPQQAARELPPKIKADAADTPTAPKRPRIARKASRPKDRTPVRRAQAVAAEDRQGYSAVAEHPVHRPAAVAERSMLAAEEKVVRAVRHVERQTYTVRRKEASQNLWTRIFGPDDDDEDDD